MTTDLNFPALSELPARPKRVVWHWTAGNHTPTLLEENHYHILIAYLDGHPATPSDDFISIRRGVPIARNMQTVSGPTAYHDPHNGYAAGVASLNSHSIHLALCGMRGAVDFRPHGSVSPGSHPITLEQLRALLAVSVQIAGIYGLEINERTFLGHHEAEDVYGVTLTPGRWDVSWLPGFNLARSECGPFLRAQLQKWMDGEQIDDRLYDPPTGTCIETAGEEG